MGRREVAGKQQEVEGRMSAAVGNGIMVLSLGMSH